MRDWKLENLLNGKEIPPFLSERKKRTISGVSLIISERIFWKITVPFDFQPKFPDPLANLIQGKHPTDPMISVFIGSNGDPRNEFNCKREQHYLGSPVLGLNKLRSKIFGKKVLPGQLCKALDACQAEAATKQHVMCSFLLTTIIFSCNPSKFCISRKHTVNFPTSTFSAQTVAAS